MARHNRPHAAALALQVKARPQRCFTNSQLALARLGGAVVYVEGYIIYHIPIEHGWLYDPATDTILDVTLDDIPAEHYFPGIQLALGEIKELGATQWYLHKQGAAMQAALNLALAYIENQF